MPPGRLGVPGWSPSDGHVAAFEVRSPQGEASSAGLSRSRSTAPDPGAVPGPGAGLGHPAGGRRGRGPGPASAAVGVLRPPSAGLQQLPRAAGARADTDAGPHRSVAVRVGHAGHRHGPVAPGARAAAGDPCPRQASATGADPTGSGVSSTRSRAAPWRRSTAASDGEVSTTSRCSSSRMRRHFVSTTRRAGGLCGLVPDSGGCLDGTRGETSWDRGRVACWVTRTQRPRLAHVRWTDEGSLVYGVLNGTTNDLARLASWWSARQDTGSDIP